MTDTDPRTDAERDADEQFALGRQTGGIDQEAYQAGWDREEHLQNVQEMFRAAGLYPGNPRGNLAGGPLESVSFAVTDEDDRYRYTITISYDRPEG